MKKLLPLLIAALLIVYFLNLSDLATILIGLGLTVLSLGAFYYFRKVWFFRDPRRTPPTETNVILSPVDGRVIYIKQIEKGAIISNKLGKPIEIAELMHGSASPVEEGWIVGIYMTPFDVHYTYAPVAGHVERINHVKASGNLPMVDLWEYVNFVLLRRAVDLFSRAFHFVNERMTMSLRNDDMTVHAVLIADKFVNKITTFVGERSAVARGQKLAFIARGSQVDLVIPRKDVTFLVKFNQQVTGAQTIVAKY